jgi:isopenicillin N synthase-like dioxygenase
MADAIPVLDLARLLANAPGAVASLGEQLRRAFTEIGFYTVKNHGVPDALVQAAFREAERFHAQPMEAKLAMEFDEHNTGYLPMRGATTRMNALGKVYKPNANEAVFFKRDLPAEHPDVVAKRRFRNRQRWPELPGFREVILQYCQAMQDLGCRLLPLYAAALDMPLDFFTQRFREPMFTLRMTHYPQQDPMTADEEWGLAPHADTSFMTILAQNQVPGLSVMLPDGRWLDAPAPAGTFQVNGGMMLHRWTNGKFLATPHRVTNRSGRERYAIPFFMDADYGTEISPLPTCVDAQHPAQWEPFTYLQFMNEYAGRNYAEREAQRPAKGEVEVQGA